jgi:hypothetical protein
MPFTRRAFVRTVPGFGAFLVAGRPAVQAPPPDATWPMPPPPIGAPVDPSFPAHHPFAVKEMVGVAHTNLDRVNELLRHQPALAKASWDWGFGDWETALGAASHVGQRAIALTLLDHGAPPTLFSATMLGQLDVVEAWLTAEPDLLHVRGPHSIPLIAHAQAGGDGAAAVLRFLQSRGAQRPNVNEPLTDDERASLEGEYVFGDRPRDRFVVDTQKNQLGITRVGGSRRNLLHAGKLEFHPIGALEVKIRFERADGRVVALGLFDPDLIVTARRAAASQRVAQ